MAKKKKKNKKDSLSVSRDHVWKQCMKDPKFRDVITRGIARGIQSKILNDIPFSSNKLDDTLYDFLYDLSAQISEELFIYMQEQISQ